MKPLKQSKAFFEIWPNFVSRFGFEQNDVRTTNFSKNNYSCC